MRFVRWLGWFGLQTFGLLSVSELVAEPLNTKGTAMVQDGRTVVNRVHGRAVYGAEIRAAMSSFSLSR